jgi:bacteriocin biosynthesis cyclodehydratase domain-containing protein
MASAFRMTMVDGESGATVPWSAACLVSSGAFGSAVAERLIDYGHQGKWVTNPTVSGLAGALVVGPSIPIVSILWREWPELSEELDKVAHARSAPWLPVVLDHPEVRVGPLVLPGQSPCYKCFLARRRQHEQQTAVLSALHAAYDANSELGPRGYLMGHVLVAASIAKTVTRDVDQYGGQLILFDVLQHEVNASLVTSVHGCERCAADASRRARSAEILAALRSAWPSASDG